MWSRSEFGLKKICVATIIITEKVMTDEIPSLGQNLAQNSGAYLST